VRFDAVGSQGVRVEVTSRAGQDVKSLLRELARGREAPMPVDAPVTTISC